MKRANSILLEQCPATDDEEWPAKKAKTEFENANDAPQLEELCDDLLYEIFKRLNPLDLLHLRTINGRLRDYVLEKRLWYEIDLSSKPLPPHILQHVLNRISNKTTSLLLWSAEKMPLYDYAYKDFTHELIYSLKAAEESLTVLELCNVALDMDDISFRDFPANLRRLALKTCSLKKCDRTSSLFGGIDAKLKNLEDLAIENNDWMEPQYFPALSKLPSLKRLSLKGCSQLHNFVPYCGPAARYGFLKLRSLDLRWCPLDSSDLQCFSSLLNLRELLLERPKVEPEEGELEISNFARVIHLHKDTIQDTTDTTSLDDLPSTSRAALTRPHQHDGQTRIGYRPSHNQVVVIPFHPRDEKLFDRSRFELVEIAFPQSANSRSIVCGRNNESTEGSDNNRPSTSRNAALLQTQNASDNAPSTATNPVGSPSHASSSSASRSSASSSSASSSSASSTSTIASSSSATSGPAQQSTSAASSSRPSTANNDDSNRNVTPAPQPSYPRYTSEIIDSTHVITLLLRPPGSSDQENASNTLPKLPRSITLTRTSAASNTIGENGRPSANGACSERGVRLLPRNDYSRNQMFHRRGPFSQSLAIMSYRPSDLFNIMDHAIYSFGRARAPPQQNIIFIRHIDRRLDNTLERVVLRNYPGITDFTLNHLMQTSPSLRYIDVSGTNVTVRGVLEFRLRLRNVEVIADHLNFADPDGYNPDSDDDSDDADNDEGYGAYGQIIQPFNFQMPIAANASDDSSDSDRDWEFE